jgi:signal transduction histidine kinase
MGGNIMLFIVSVIIASILLGFNWGIGVVGVSTIYIVGIYVLVASNKLAFNFEYESYMYEFSSWLVFAAAFIALTIVCSYLISMISDIAYKNVADLEVQKQELVEVNNTKDKLMSVIAHDLRSPFQGLIAGLELFNDDEKVFSEEEQKKLFQSMLRDSTSTFSMLENLLYWSRAQMGELKLEPRYFEVSDFVSECIHPYCPLAKQKGIDAAPEIKPGSLIFADQSSIKIILCNLVHNAIKFTEKGGKIRVKASSDGKKTHIVVSDSGRGLSVSEQKNIFEKRTGFTTRGTNNEAGTGLGLAISLELTELNKGTLRHEENSDGGSDFILEFPASP